MIQLNLLPDVKTKYIKAQKSKRTVILTSLMISGASLAILFLLASYVYVGQKIRLSGLESDIKKNTATLKKVDGLDKILTVQNQLNKLTDLHDEKPVASRMFSYLPQITPNDTQISNLEVDFEENTITISGSAKSLESVNKYVDTLKFTDYFTDKNPNKKRAFSEVVLTSFSVSGSTSEITYKISLKYDTEIFNSSNQNVTFEVPKITSTRSQTERPGELFKTQPATEETN